MLAGCPKQRVGERPRPGRRRLRPMGQPRPFAVAQAVGTPTRPPQGVGSSLEGVAVLAPGEHLLERGEGLGPATGGEGAAAPSGPRSRATWSSCRPVDGAAARCIAGLRSGSWSHDRNHRDLPTHARGRRGPAGPTSSACSPSGRATSSSWPVCGRAAGARRRLRPGIVARTAADLLAGEGAVTGTDLLAGDSGDRHRPQRGDADGGGPCRGDRVAAGGCRDPAVRCGTSTSCCRAALMFVPDRVAALGRWARSPSTAARWRSGLGGPPRRPAGIRPTNVPSPPSHAGARGRRPAELYWVAGDLDELRRSCEAAGLGHRYPDPARDSPLPVVGPGRAGRDREHSAARPTLRSDVRLIRRDVVAALAPYETPSERPRSRSAATSSRRRPDR